MSLGDSNENSNTEFDINKFTDFIAFNDELRNLYYDLTEVKGNHSSWDVHQIQERRERPTKEEVMNEIFETRILGTRHLSRYLTAARDFKKNIRSKIK